MLSKSKLLAVGLLIAVGATGFASGHASALYRGKCEGGRRERPSFSGLLQDSLGLSNTQRDSVRAILERHRHEMDAIFATVRPKADSMRGKVNDEIAASLTPAQREKFTAMRNHWRTERARRDSAGRAAEGAR